MQTTELDLTGLTADIVSAYVAHNALTGDNVLLKC
jgi:predicted transcriptional regulator